MKIMITSFRGYNPEAFANIKVGTIHNVIRKVDAGWLIKGSNGAEVEKEANRIFNAGVA